MAASPSPPVGPDLPPRKHQAAEHGRRSMEMLEGAAATKRARASENGGGADRLSALPDSLLHAIMSFLKARQAVQTCVLATRWRHLWRTVPRLDVDHHEFCTTAAAPPSSRNRDQQKKKDDWEDFEDFTHNLLRRVDLSQLDSLSLRVARSSRAAAPGSAPIQAGGWLRRAIKHSGGGSGSCWRLKRLYLCNVALDDRFEEKVRSVCGKLEELELVDCVIAFQAIVSCSLKCLVLRSCWWRYLSQIMAPSLERLVVDGGSNDGRCVVVAPAITHLHLDVPLYFAKRISVNHQMS